MKNIISRLKKEAEPLRTGNLPRYESFTKQIPRTQKKLMLKIAIVLLVLGLTGHVLLVFISD
jgi:hypothetical protein